MKKIYACMYVCLAMVVVFFLISKQSRIEYIQVTGKDGNFHEVVHSTRIDKQTFVVPLQPNQFYRVSSDKETVITAFLPAGDTHALIHFEYVK